MINFIPKKDAFKDKLDSLKKITTYQEKEALLIEDEDIYEILKCFTDVIPSNELEAEAMLLRIREISVGDEIDYIVTCPHCDTINNFNVSTDECYDFKPVKFLGQDLPVGLFTSMEEIINNEEMDLLSVKEYSELEELLQKRNRLVFSKILNKNCRKCNGVISIGVDPIKVFSKSTLVDIYRDYVNISMFTNSGKLDIDSLYPFEREIFNSLITDKMKADET